LARQYGFTEALFLVSHLAGRIEAHFGDGRDFGVAAAYCAEDPPLGTAGALRHAAGRLAERFLLLYGDVFIDCDLGRLWADHAAHRPVATLVVHPNDHPHDSDLVEVDAEGRVTALHPRARAPERYLANLVNAGAGALRAYRSAEYFKDFGTPERLAQVRADFARGDTARRRRDRRRPAVFLDR